MPPLETPPPPLGDPIGGVIYLRIFCLQRKHLVLCSITKVFLRRGVVSTSLNPQAGGPPGVGCPRLLIQYIRSYPPNWRPFLRVYRVLVGKPEGRRPLGRPRLRWEDNIRMDLRGVGCRCVEWMELAQDRDRWRALVSAVMNLWVL
jgi:hypothetical protein